MQDMKVSIIAIGSRVIIEPDAGDSYTPSGIAIPNPAKPYRGTIVSVGDGVESSSLVEEDIVFYLPYSGVEITIDGRKLLALTESDIICTIV